MRKLIGLGLLVMLAAGLAGCGGEQRATPRGPLDCLKNAGLSQVEQRDSTMWRGFNDDPVYAVFVQRLSNPNAAAQLDADADLTIDRHVGSFYVNGPAAGPGVPEIVSAVANCLDPTTS